MTLEKSIKESRTSCSIYVRLACCLFALLLFLELSCNFCFLFSSKSYTVQAQDVFSSGSYTVNTPTYGYDYNSYDWVCIKYSGNLKDTNTIQSNYLSDHTGHIFVRGSGPLKDRRAFCIIPTKKHLDGAKMQVKKLEELLKLHYGFKQEKASQIAQKIALISLYGWELGSKSDLEKCATQVLIWYACGWTWNAENTSGHRKINPKLQAEMKRIESLVKKHEQKPSFNSECPTLKVGETHIFTDKNQVLPQYMRASKYLANKTYVMNNCEYTWLGDNRMKIKPLKQQTGEHKVEITNVENKYLSNPIGLYGKSQSAVVASAPVAISSNIRYRMEEPEVKASLKIYKVYGKTPLKGAVFTLQSGNNSWELTTDEKGIAQIDNLKEGEYTLKETIAPVGYVLDPTERKFTLKAPDNTVEFISHAETISNQPQRTKLSIKKVSDKELPLAGAIFSLTLEKLYVDADKTSNKWQEGQELAMLTSNESGIAEISDLPLGKYTLKEITAPNGYVLDSKIYDLELAYQGQNISLALFSKEIENQPQLGKISLTKHATNKENELLKDAHYDLILDELYADDARGLTVGEKVDTLITDENGKASISDLPLGHYTLTETKAPLGMVLDPTPIICDLRYVDQHINLQLHEVKASNDYQKGQIEIKKISQTEDQAPLAGAEFDVIAKSFTYEKPDDLSPGDVVCTLKTDKNGYAISKPLPLGIYLLQETKAPHGYVLQQEPLTLELSYGDQLQSLVLRSDTLTNTPQQGRITLHKFDQHNAPLADATFTIYAEEYFNKHDTLGEIGQAVATMTSDASGQCTSPNLPLGRYRIEETKAPFGYVVCEPFYISLNYGDQVQELVSATEEVFNLPQQGQISLRKFDATNRQPLAGAEFKLSVISLLDERDYEKYPVGSSIATLVTDSYGYAISENLPLGTYQLEEVVPPTGFILDDTPHTVELAYGDQKRELIFTTVGIGNQPIPTTTNTQPTITTTSVKPTTEVSSTKKPVSALAKTGSKNYHRWVALLISMALTISALSSWYNFNRAQG